MAGGQNPQLFCEYAKIPSLHTLYAILGTLER